MTAPAARSRRVISASSVAAGSGEPVPWKADWPATSRLSLTAIGTPSSGRSSPRAMASSAAAASAWAVSNSVRKAFSLRVEPGDPLQADAEQLRAGDRAVAQQLALAVDAREGDLLLVHPTALASRSGSRLPTSQ